MRCAFSSNDCSASPMKRTKHIEKIIVATVARNRDHRRDDIDHVYTNGQIPPRRSGAVSSIHFRGRAGYFPERRDRPYLLPRVSPTGTVLPSDFLNAQNEFKNSFPNARTYARTRVGQQPAPERLVSYARETLRYYTIGANGWVRIEEPGGATTLIVKLDLGKTYLMDPVSRSVRIGAYGRPEAASASTAAASDGTAAVVEPCERSRRGAANVSPAVRAMTEGGCEPTSHLAHNGAKVPINRGIRHRSLHARHRARHRPSMSRPSIGKSHVSPSRSSRSDRPAPHRPHSRSHTRVWISPTGRAASETSERPTHRIVRSSYRGRR